MNEIKINLYELLGHLEKRKAMYLGNEYTFQSLDSFLCGFGIACSKDQLKSENYNDFSGFNFWILGYLPEHFGRSGGWYWQIKNRNPENDENAFKEFFDFLEIYKTSKKKKEIIKIARDSLEMKKIKAKKNVGILCSKACVLV